MHTVYVRISDVSALEDACPEGAEENIDVHIVSDEAWSPDDALSVMCDFDSSNDVKTLLPEVSVLSNGPSELARIRRLFGC